MKKTIEKNGITVEIKESGFNQNVGFIEIKKDSCKLQGLYFKADDHMQFMWIQDKIEFDAEELINDVESERLLNDEWLLSIFE